MTKRKSIGETPWDVIVPPKTPPPSTAAVKTKKVKTTAGRSEPPSHGGTRVEKERLTVHVSVAVIERAKNAVFWTPGLTLAGLAESALVKALEGLEKANGGAFERRKGELKGGRPMK